MLKVAINGYGRIGRIAHRVILERFTKDIDLVAVNAGSSTDIKGWMYLLKYDTAYGTLKNNLSIKEEGKGIGKLIVDGKPIEFFAIKEPKELPWKDLNIDVVIESTGHFETEAGLKMHLEAGARAVVLSAPVKEGDINTYVWSVNGEKYHREKIISNASCTTNCITPVAKVMVDYFGVEKAMMSTIHGYTSDQRLQDGGHKDYRRARAASQNIVPTSTGATIAASKALPELEGIFTGLAFRVPVVVGSLSDFTFVTKRKTTVEEVNSAFEAESRNKRYDGTLQVTRDPIVSSDIVGNSASAIIDLSLTQVVGENLVKVVAWYDNEYGYANRLVEEVIMVGNQL
ncbi:MAG: type I glyceraldehyde-3-phosphate dehydrogenase [Candidatus Levybacteria bacterium RBG_16_35_6]|nr:MAG: type I glyceraldehyde-3-phosphate dehydrogenase [Candidatus Levybacteria bacterium RBG_16_35_6]